MHVTGQKGFSVTSALVFTALFSITVLISARTLSFGFRSQRAIASEGTAQDLLTNIEQLMWRNSFCGSVLLNREFDPGSSDSADKIIGGIRIVYPADPTNVVAEPGMVLDGTRKVSEIFLNDFTPTSANEFSAYLNVSFVKGTQYTNTMDRKTLLHLETELTPSAVDSATRRRITGCNYIGDIRNDTDPAEAYMHFEVIDTNKRWRVPAEANRIMVEVWGAGGGGASSYMTTSPDRCGAGGGGGAGGYGRKVFRVPPGMPYDVSIGIGGAGGLYPTPPAFAVPIPGFSQGDGMPGTDTRFGNEIFATGGKGGFRGRPDLPTLEYGIGGVGGTSNGEEHMNGGQGMTGKFNYDFNYGGKGGIGGAGGAGGVASGFPAGGGVGGYCEPDVLDRNGKNGFNGRVMVWW